MKKKILFLMLAIVFIFTTVAFAEPPGVVKNSPLFKASLKKTVEKMEGKITEDDHGSFPTIKGQVCIMMPWTQSSTCSPSVCSGGETCQGTCQNTCDGSGTCWSTCYNTCTTCYGTTCYGTTCVGTCISTCVPGACEIYRFISNSNVYWSHAGHSGNDWWHLYGGYYACDLQSGGYPGNVYLALNGEGYNWNSPDGVFGSSGNFDVQKTHPADVTYAEALVRARICQNCDNCSNYPYNYRSFTNPSYGYDNPNYVSDPLYIGY
jgi:hypothetical protein